MATPILIPPSLAHSASGCGRHGHRQRSPPQAHVLVRTYFYFISASGGNSARPRGAIRGVLPPRVRAVRLTMYGTNLHQRLHRSVDIEGALCPHIMPLALFPPFLARQKGCARRVGALPGGGTPNGGGNIICGPTDTVDRTIKCRKFSKTLPGKRGGRFDLFPLKTAICGCYPCSFCI